MPFARSQRHPLVTLSLFALCLVVTFLPGADALYDLYLIMKAVVWVYYDLPPIWRLQWPRHRSKLIAALLVLQLSQPPIASAFGTSTVRSLHLVTLVEFRITPHPDFDQEGLRHDGTN